MLDSNVQKKLVEIGVFYLQTFGEPEDVEKVVFNSKETSNDGAEITVILNRNYPSIRVPVRIKSLLEAEAVEIGGKRKDSGTLARILVQLLFMDNTFIDHNAEYIINHNTELIQSSIG